MEYILEYFKQTAEVVMRVLFGLENKMDLIMLAMFNHLAELSSDLTSVLEYLVLYFD